MPNVLNIDSVPAPYGNVRGANMDWKANGHSGKEDFKAWVRKGPMNIFFNCLDDFFSYSSGVYNGPNCTPSQGTNHAMNAIGFGVENGVEYALIRNSHGSGWGMGGYMKAKLDDSTWGTCGLYE